MNNLAQETKKRVGVLVLKNNDNNKINIKHSADIETLLNGLVKGFAELDENKSRYRSYFSKTLKEDMLKFKDDPQALYNNFTAVYAVIPDMNYIESMKTWFYNVIPNSGDYNIYAKYADKKSAAFKYADNAIKQGEIELYSFDLYNNKSQGISIAIEPGLKENVSNIVGTAVNRLLGKLGTPGTISVEKEVDMVKEDVPEVKEDKVTITHYITKEYKIDPKDIKQYLLSKASQGDEIVTTINGMEVSINVDAYTGYNKYNVQVRRGDKLLLSKSMYSEGIDAIVNLLNAL